MKEAIEGTMEFSIEGKDSNEIRESALEASLKITSQLSMVIAAAAAKASAEVDDRLAPTDVAYIMMGSVIGSLHNMARSISQDLSDENVHQDQFLFAALIASNSVMLDGPAGLYVRGGPSVFKSALDMFEKLVGRQPEGVNPNLIAAANNAEEVAKSKAFFKRSMN